MIERESNVTQSMELFSLQKSFFYLCLIIWGQELVEISTAMLQNQSIISEHLGNWRSWLIIHWTVYSFFCQFDC